MSALRFALCVRQARDGNCLFVAVARVSGDKRLSQITTNNQVSFQWKNPDFLLRNPDLLFRNPDFLLKNVDFVTKTRA